MSGLTLLDIAGRLRSLVSSDHSDSASVRDFLSKVPKDAGVQDVLARYAWNSVTNSFSRNLSRDHLQSLAADLMGLAVGQSGEEGGPSHLWRDRSFLELFADTIVEPQPSIIGADLGAAIQHTTTLVAKALRALSSQAVLYSGQDVDLLKNAADILDACAVLASSCPFHSRDAASLTSFIELVVQQVHGLQVGASLLVPTGWEEALDSEKKEVRV